MVLKDVQVLIPGTCESYLIGKRDIEDVIKLNNLTYLQSKMERLSSIIKVGPKCNRKGPYEREAEGDVMTRAQVHVMMGAEIGLVQP